MELNLSQNDVSLLTRINKETIRRIEGGKVIPKFETLEYLAVIYKLDLNNMFLEYRINDFSYLCDLRNKLEKKFDGNEFYALNIELKELNLLIDHIDNLYYKNYLNQLSLLTEAVILYKEKNNFPDAMNKLIKAIIITSPRFNLENYKLLIYSTMEIRILMNIAFVFNKLNNNVKYVELLEYCINLVGDNSEMYPKLCHNLAAAYRRSKDYKKALNYSNLGIISSQTSRQSTGLTMLYYGKGISEYHLGKSGYKDSILTSIYLCKATGHEELKKEILYYCKEIFNMEF